MFLRDGIKAIRMDDIATSLSMSKRTLYKFFDDKESLLIECIHHFHQVVSQKQKEAVKDATNVIEELAISLKGWDEFASQNYHLMTSVKKFYPHIYAQITAKKYQEGSLELREKLERGISQGLFLKRINIDLSMLVFTYSLYGIVSGEDIILPNNVSQADAFKYVITYFFRGIATSKGIEMLDSYMEN